MLAKIINIALGGRELWMTIHKEINLTKNNASSY